METKLREIAERDLAHPMRLTALTLARIGPRPCRPDPAGQQRMGVFLGGGFAPPAQFARCDGDIVQHGHVREQLELLEHETDFTARPVHLGLLGAATPEPFIAAATAIDRSASA